MARTLTAPGPLDTLEEAFDLLQQAPAAVWMRYLLGAAPLMIGLLFEWGRFSTSEAGRVDPILASLFLLALLVWFYYSRQNFARSLRDVLSARDSAAPSRAWWAACFEGTRLIVIPLAILSVLSIAYVTSFYRGLTLFAAEGLPAGEVFAKSRKFAVAWQRENWLGLGILVLLGFVVLIDVGIAVIIAPMLLKMFTGYENIATERFSASAGLPVILLLAWLCFDPLLQAVYTVRAFHWDGLRTGEDLLVRLKRLAPLLAIVCFLPCFASGQTTKSDGLPHELNRTIDQVLQGHDYDWRIPPAGSDAKRDWFVDLVDRTMGFFQRVWKGIGDLWADLMDWIRTLLGGDRMVAEKVNTNKPSGAVRPVFYLIGIVFLAIAGVLVWKFRPRKNEEALAIAGASGVDLNKEGLLASDLPEDEWLAMAERHAGTGDLRLALRALYLGTLAMLNGRGFVTIHASKTNRDYEGEVRRRSRDNALTHTFGANVRSFERSWYGFHEVTGEQLQLFRDNLARMR